MKEYSAYQNLKLLNTEYIENFEKNFEIFGN